MKTTLLTDAEFHATFVAPMRNITGSDREVVDIWPYIDAIPPADLLPFRIHEPIVEQVSRTGDDAADHVLIPTTTKNVYLFTATARDGSSRSKSQLKVRPPDAIARLSLLRRNGSLVSNE